MYKTLTLLVLLALISGALAGCASTDAAGSPDSQPVSVGVASGFYGQGETSPPMPVVVGDIGREPKISAGVGLPGTTPSISYLANGSDESVHRGVLPLVRYVEADWKTATVLHSTWRNGGDLETVPVSGANYAMAFYFDSLHIGSRVEIVNPTGNGDADIFVIDVVQQGAA